MTVDRLELPIGDASFRNIRERNFYYVDKTPHIRSLTQRAGYYFLSRPRRFGKSLLIDTLHELFAGSEELFRGLYIHERWDWNNKHPVVRLSFDANYSESGNLKSNIFSQLATHEKRAGIKPPPEARTAPDRLQNLIISLYDDTGQQVVVLIDEYDKPILDALENKELARENRDYLRGFYGMIKGCARYIRFVFITGISMYSKVSLFSVLNNLYDLSLDPEYATLCGYTDDDLETVFAPELANVTDDDRENIRHWYNGYHWRGKEKVYNPFDILLYFQRREFLPWWYETGTPSFLYERMASGAVNTLDLENLSMSRRNLSTFEVGRVNLNALLFQCGYLTIVEEEVRPEGILFTLDYPNHEVRLSLNQELLDAATGDLEKASEDGRALIALLDANDFAGFERELQAFFAGIPYQNYDHGNLAHFEGYYASLLYACFVTLGTETHAEASTSRGRADMVLVLEDQVFVLEFKVAKEVEAETKADEALAQMKEKDYAGKYRAGGRKIHRLALVFDQQKRNLAKLRAG